MAFVVVSIGGEEVSRHPLVTPTVIGRSVDADISIRDASMSRWHCKLSPAGDPANVWEITDLGSRNGTTLNGRRITRHVLHHGDLLRIGRVTVFFSEAEYTPPPSADAPTSVLERPLSPAAARPTPRPAGFPRPLLVPKDRLPRPLPATPPSRAAATARTRPSGPDLELMSSPGWSRHIGHTTPTPSVDVSPGELTPPDPAHTLDLNTPVGRPPPNSPKTKRLLHWLTNLFRR